MNRKPWLWVAGLTLSCVGGLNADHGAQSASTVALSSDDALLYAVDTDSALLGVIDTVTEEKIAEVKVGDGAHLVVVSGNDTVFVANRGDGTVSVIRRGTWVEAARWPAGLEPVGLALSRDERLLYVVSAVAADTGAHGSLLWLDTETGHLEGELALGEEPRSIALTDATHAAVTLLKAGDVQWVDLAKHSVVKAGTGLFDQLNGSQLQLTTPNVETQHPRGVTAIAASPDGRQVHALGVVARSGTPNAWAGCSGTQLSTASMFTFDSNGASLADDLFSCGGGNSDAPPTLLLGRNASGSRDDNPNLMQGPAALALERTGRWIYVVNQQSNNVAIVPTRADRSTAVFTGDLATVDAVVGVGAGPNGIAVRRDGTRAYVYNAFDHTVSVLTGDDRGAVKKSRDILVTHDVLPPAVTEGRRVFFDAVDSRMSASRFGAACATCHLDNGREDGHVWDFAEGKRQTVSLAGRLAGTEPFHWDGRLENMSVLMQHTTTERMGGVGATEVMANQVEAYLVSLPAPLNPKQRLEPSDARKRGAMVFQKAECGTCHSGEMLTNNAFAHVGSDETGATTVAFPFDGVNVPSLRGMTRTAPFLHDGSAATLTDRLTQGKGSDRHGKTSQLSSAEVADLVEYLDAL